MAEVGVVLQHKAGWLRVMGLALLTLLAACQAGGPRPAAGGSAPRATDAPTASVLPQDEARHRIALLVPMTGPDAAFGQSIANAANLALLDTATERLRMTIYDTAPGAAVAAQKAVADGNRLFLGPLLARDVKAVGPIAAKAGVPILAFSNDPAVAGPGVYLLGFSPEQSIRRVVSYAKARGALRFAGLVPARLYGRNAAASLTREVAAAGGQLVAVKSYDSSPQSLTAAVAALGKGEAYDAVLIADGGRVAVVAAQLVRKASPSAVHILGTEMWNADEVVAGAPALHGAWYASVADGLFGQLAGRYRARYGIAPSRLASLGYDAVLLSVRVAGDWKVGTPFPVARLEDKGGFGGIDGAFRFGRSHLAERALEVHEVGPGGGSTASPAPRSFD